MSTDEDDDGVVKAVIVLLAISFAFGFIGRNLSVPYQERGNPFLEGGEERSFSC